MADGSIGGGKTESRSVELRAEIEENEEAIKWRKSRLIQKKKELHEKMELRGIAAEGQALAEALGQLETENADLAFAIADEQEAIAEAKERYRVYRKNVRRILWMKSENQELQAEDFLTGSPLKDARISKVDATGLLVRHQTGVTRVGVAHLSPALRERLDLSVEEAQAAMMALYLKDAKLKKAMNQKPRVDAPTEAEIEAMMISSLRERKEKAWKLADLARKARAEIQRSRHEDAYSTNRSVPASLETWRERTQRFEAALVRYQKNLGIAIEEVRELEPGFALPD